MQFFRHGCACACVCKPLSASRCAVLCTTLHHLTSCRIAVVQVVARLARRSLVAPEAAYATTNSVPYSGCTLTIPSSRSLAVHSRLSGLRQSMVASAAASASLTSAPHHLISSNVLRRTESEIASKIDSPGGHDDERVGRRTEPADGVTAHRDLGRTCLGYLIGLRLVWLVL
ncbi:hypothetical protein KC329_g76 [Hortaea werneckii]|nr:hypothetical protein KC329_g76 [Hortaea werneckii]